MALYHFHVTQISRGKGQRIVAAAAYRSGEKLEDKYYGDFADYTRKSHVLHTEILLPFHAPERFKDRETLWNEVEFTEKNAKAQLAYSFDIALQNELTREENIELARQFVLENFVAKGMIVDLAIHDPDKGKGGIPNPHFHVLVPMRPLNPDGTWGTKQKREYALDEAGNRIRDANGKYIFNAISTTDWNSPDTLNRWRANWTELVNNKFEEKGISERIDHRSFAEQGSPLLPTIHEGPNVRAMEKRGIKTEIGDTNREIKKYNNLFQKLLKFIKDLFNWSEKKAQEKISYKEKSSSIEATPVNERKALYDAILSIHDKQDAKAIYPSQKARALKSFASNLCFLQSNNINSFEDFSHAVSELYDKANEALCDYRDLQRAIRDFEDDLKYIDYYQSNKSVYDKLCKIKTKAQSDIFKREHKPELDKFYMARRQLEKKYPDFKIPLSSIKKDLKKFYDALPSFKHQYEELEKEAKSFYSVKKALEAELNIETKKKQKHRQESL